MLWLKNLPCFNMYEFFFQQTNVKIGEYLSSIQLENLNEIDPSPTADAKFVSLLLCVLFKESVLKQSSYRGGASNFNQKRHSPLDSTKIEFMKSMN